MQTYNYYMPTNSLGLKGTNRQSAVQLKPVKDIITHFKISFLVK